MVVAPRFPRRWTRVAAYAFMAAAGTAALIWPAPSVERATGATSGITVYAWALLLAVGSMSAMLGSVLESWIGEYVGLLPLIATFSVYSIAAAATGKSMAIAASCILGAFALFLLARWWDVDMTRREAVRLRSRE